MPGKHELRICMPVPGTNGSKSNCISARYFIVVRYIDVCPEIINSSNYCLYRRHLKVDDFFCKLFDNTARHFVLPFDKGV